MEALAEAILWVLADSFGTLGILERLSDPFWFQALGCLLGFDWHSSGLTTTTCGALKEALRRVGSEIGLFAAGGKGRAARRTPEEIVGISERTGIDPAPLIRASRLSAKVDSAALQDGFQVYHHAFFFDREGRWCVVQQGMNEGTGMARRYHWVSEGLRSFVAEPHRAVVGERRGVVLNLVAAEAAPAREAIPQLAARPPEITLAELGELRALRLPRRHELLMEDLDPRRLEGVLLRAYESGAPDFERLLEVPGLGAKGLRALALVSELVHGAPASTRDPARFAYAHGGKDRTPYPVDLEAYDRTIEALRKAVEMARLGRRERLEAIKRLHQLFPVGK